MGLKAGLWFEPEMISPSSSLREAHPDWVQEITNRVPTRTRDQWVLDLANDEVVDYLIRTLEDMIRKTGIDYIKWDMNRPLIDLGSRALPAGRQGEISHRHVLAVYRIQEQILHDFPHLLIENCAGGGSRFDAGMLYYSPQIWCSDDMDPVERLRIQEGTELVYPISCMGSHLGSSPYGITSRVSSFDSRALCAMMGTFGYELDLTKLPEEELAKIPAQVALYKRLQPLLQQGDYYRIASYAENGWLDCVEIAAADGSHAAALAVQVLTRPNQKSFRLYLRGLDPAAVYRVRVVDSAQQAMGEWDGADRIAGKTAGDGSAEQNAVRQNRTEKGPAAQTYPGDALMQAGFPLPQAIHDFYARLLLIERV